ncbi:MAG: TadE/TadG family type IV pilus assembly protein [Panacagrimonas sp.]
MNSISLQTQQRQTGAAALEFALVFPTLFFLLYGMLSYGALMFTQLTVSRAVEDGARVLALLPNSFDTLARDLRIKTEVIESLASTPIVPAANNGSIEERRIWLNEHVFPTRITVVDGPCASCVTITLNFPYASTDRTRLFPSIDLPLIGDMEWIPSALNSQATVQR